MAIFGRNRFMFSLADTHAHKFEIITKYRTFIWVKLEIGFGDERGWNSCHVQRAVIEREFYDLFEMVYAECCFISF